MAIRSTMADNHLSGIAKKGRGGDTEVARASTGELWHVNPQEKALMNMYGMEGERMVKAIGSGTTNPQTGLKEYEPVTTTAALTATEIIAGVGITLGAIAQSSAGGRAWTQAGSNIRAADIGLESLEGAEERLGTARTSKIGAVQQDYTLGLEGLSTETGIRTEDLQKGTAQAVQKSGLVTSGTIEQNRETTWNRIRDAFGRGRTGLMADLGRKMGEIEGWYAGEVARIATERKKFENQKALAQEQRDAWYLGKNVAKAGRWLKSVT